MLVSLLTPLMLTTEPVKIDMPAPTYSHATQMSTLSTVTPSYQNSTTYNGTQTYDYRGNPNDSDNDSDPDPY